MSFDEWERRRNIDMAKDFPYREFLSDDGVKTFSPKPQYVRGGELFKCPFCDFKCSSHSYNCYRGFEEAILEHIGEKHECPHNYDSCGLNCGKFRITKEGNKCTLKDKVN